MGRTFEVVFKPALVGLHLRAKVRSLLERAKAMPLGWRFVVVGFVWGALCASWVQFTIVNDLHFDSLPLLENTRRARSLTDSNKFAAVGVLGLAISFLVAAGAWAETDKFRWALLTVLAYCFGFGAFLMWFA